MSWRVAKSLDVLLAEINDHAPGRNRVSDGSIGDAAHASRTSDHNPWVTVNGMGVVRARDFTHDPPGGLDCDELADQLADMIRNLSHPALGPGAYLIWRRRILSRSRAGEGWRGYTGSNPHEKHLHLSVAVDPRGFDSTRPWRVFQPEDDMFSDEDRKLLRDIASGQDRLLDLQGRVLKRVNPGSAIRSKLSKLVAQGKATRAELEDLSAELDDVEAEVTKGVRK